MIGLGIDGWARVASGTKLHLVAPEGAHAGVITIRERTRQRAFRELVDSGNVLRPTFVTGPSPIVNDEGEQGVFATLRAPTPAGFAQRDLAVFAGDGFCSTIIGTTASMDHFHRTTGFVRELARRTSLWLGVRRRLVLYPPPRNWRGVARGLDAHWYSPEFPRDRSHMVVFPAVPANGEHSYEIADALQSQSAGPWEVGELSTVRGLEMHIRTSPTARIAVAVDGRYIYAARIENAVAATLAVFDATVDGIHPVPARTRAPAALAHWAE